MAEKLLKYYKYVNDIKGRDGQIELARMTSTPSIIASTLPDSPWMLKLFQNAVEKITGESVPKDIAE